MDLDAGGKYLQIRCAHGPGSEKIIGLRIPADKGIAGLVFKHKIPHRTNKLEGRGVVCAVGSAARRIFRLGLWSLYRSVVEDEVLGVAQFINKASGSLP